MTAALRRRGVLAPRRSDVPATIGTPDLVLGLTTVSVPAQVSTPPTGPTAALRRRGVLAARRSGAPVTISAPDPVLGLTTVTAAGYRSGPVVVVPDTVLGATTVHTGAGVAGLVTAVPDPVLGTTGVLLWAPGPDPDDAAGSTTVSVRAVVAMIAVPDMVLGVTLVRVTTTPDLSENPSISIAFDSHAALAVIYPGETDPAYLVPAGGGG